MQTTQTTVWSFLWLPVTGSEPEVCVSLTEGAFGGFMREGADLSLTSGPQEPDHRAFHGKFQLLKEPETS